MFAMRARSSNVPLIVIIVGSTAPRAIRSARGRVKGRARERPTRDAASPRSPSIAKTNAKIARRQGRLHRLFALDETSHLVTRAARSYSPRHADHRSRLG